MAGVRYAIGRGLSEVAIVGGMGGRFDPFHSQSPDAGLRAKATARHAVLASGDTTVFFVADAARTVARIPGRGLSVLSYTEAWYGRNPARSGVSAHRRQCSARQNFPIGLRAMNSQRISPKSPCSPAFFSPVPLRRTTSGAFPPRKRGRSGLPAIALRIHVTIISPALPPRASPAANSAGLMCFPGSGSVDREYCLHIKISFAIINVLHNI